MDYCKPKNAMEALREVRESAANCIKENREQGTSEEKESHTQEVSEEKVNHPDYYNRYGIEVIEMARRIWGEDAMRTAAEITAFIYRMRAGVKPDNPIEQDLAKEEFWLNYANSLKPTPKTIYKKSE